MKRVIYASEIIYRKEGFLFEFGNKAIFLESNQSYITDKLVRRIINAVCDYRQVGDKIREASLYNEATLADFKRRTDKATLTKQDTGKIVYYTIQGNNFTLNFPEEDFERDVILI